MHFTSVRLRLGGVICLAALSLLSVCVPARAQSDSQEALRAYGSAGERIFAVNCAPCHGEDGAGDGPALQGAEASTVDFRDPAILDAERSPASWFAVTAEGRVENLMPPWENLLSDAEMWDAVAFLWQLSTSPPELAQGRQIWQSLALPADPYAEAFAAVSMPLEEWRIRQREGPHGEAWRTLSAADEAAAYRFLQSRALMPSWEPALRDDGGAVKVVLRALSPGLELPLGMPVVLSAILDREVADSWKRPTADGGLAEFAGLDISPRVAYEAHAELDGTRFHSASVSLSALTRDAELPIDIYARSATEVSVEIGRLQILLALTDEGILVGQQALAFNGLPYIFTGQLRPDGDWPAVLEIPFFPGAREVTLASADSERYQIGENRVFDTEPLFPQPHGTWSTVGYQLPLPAPGDTWQQTWPYPIAQATVLLPRQEGLLVDVAGFTHIGIQDLEGLEHDAWQAVDMPSGSISLTFRSVPSRAASMQGFPPAHHMPEWLPWFTAGFMLLLAAVFIIGRRRSST